MKFINELLSNLGILYAGIGFFVLWLVAEFQYNKYTRIALGLTAIIFIALSVRVAVLMQPAYERKFTRDCFFEINKIAKNTGNKDLSDALNKFQDDTNSSSQYLAVINLKANLRKIEEKTKDRRL